MLISLFRGGYEPKEVIFFLVVMLFALTLSFSIHEFMHAAVATWLGDDVPGLMGRVTLNPLAHIDPMGTVLLLLVGFGWGKPVVFNPNNLTRFKSKRLMCILVSVAGVTGNFILALIFSIIATIIARVADISNPVMVGIYYVLIYTRMFCMSLLGFNLIPIPPLDGFHILEEILPYKVRYSDGYKKFVMYAPRVMMAVIILGSFANISVFGWLMTIIEWPFNTVIDLICTLIGGLF